MPSHDPTYHTFPSDQEISTLQSSLLKWFDSEQRELPWRKPFTPTTNHTLQAQRAYEVWVSEIMSQQTRIATVIAYYEKWMAKWPTMESLAKATTEEVHEVWSGLGYYSRGTRMLEAAKIVVDRFKGRLPDDPVALEKEIPGVGKYTAGAIVSQAYNKPAALVDGNVIRVLSRMRSLGMDPKSKKAMETHWALAERILDHERPGDFNQGLMELGATVCTPQNPSCETCPVKLHCHAFEEMQAFASKAKDVLLTGKKSDRKRSLDDEEGSESHCESCLPPDVDIENCAVTRYPAIAKKKAADEKDVVVAILELPFADAPSKFLVAQRPPKGLLANLWDFPHIPIESSDGLEIFREPASLCNSIKVSFGGQVKHKTSLGSVVHLFSHIRLTMNVEWFVIDANDGLSPKLDDGKAWWTLDDMETGAVPVTLKKVVKIMTDKKKGVSSVTKKAKTSDKAQPSISKFFKPRQ
ncbi:DNA glycosylase [Rhizoclosmatium globosum]|uniref:Adenine DNA glycosylase n=1 Tax=Rhizoclosmatium globosum TaxID=329046 RepID=A0A1Y2CUM8_9FUNG|nr:DNA glycosylase [Rhizoclosmatium globosum]|eukprot:ORY50015.1 DNA glycosylase [Rhizoclosmatium globosum]